MSTNGTAAPTAGEPSASPSPTPAPSSPEPSSQPPSSSDPVTESPPASTTEPPPPPSSSTPVPVSSTEEPPSTSERPSPSSSSQAPPSSTLPPSSSAPASSSEPESSTSAPPPSRTSTVTAPSTPTATEIRTSVITPTPTVSDQSVKPITVVETIIKSNTPTPTDGASAPTSSATDPSDPALAKPDSSSGSSGGLSSGGKTAIAVVIPVVAVALLLLAGIFFWRKRKSRKSAEEARRKEVEEYGYNPNDDPTLPAVGMTSEMAEDQSGYRGWGNTTTSSNRKASTTLTSGMTYSDSNSNPGDGYGNPGSPTHAYSDAHSGDPLVNGRRETMDSDGIGALGAAPVANQNQTGVHRGPSNASSSYSAADRSDNSGDYPIPINNPQEYYDNNAYYQSGPYDNAYGAGQQPIIRDVSARRNTRIENPSVFPQQGNSGIAQNF